MIEYEAKVLNVDLGVTHWHCIAREPERASDPRRFDHNRMLAERAHRPDHVAASPDEVVAWLSKITDNLAPGNTRVEARAEIWSRMAEHGQDVCTMLAVSTNRIVHYNAYAMTEQDCSINH